MNKFCRQFCFVVIALCFVVIGLDAQTISVSAPSQVGVGENFRLSYTVNTQDVDDFRAGNIPPELEVIAGPYTSSQSSFQMVNGHTSSSSSITYTYTLYANKNGTYTIPSAKAVVNGKTIVSQAVKIIVSGTTKSNNGASTAHGDEDFGRQMKAAGSKISGNDLFIKVNASKNKVYEQEPVLLTYKVYTLVELTQLEGKMPDLTGFHTQEVPLPQQKSFHVEKVNGKNYRCVTWSQYLMYPQITGKLEIPPITFKGIVVQQNKLVDPFEAFFNGGSGYIEVNKAIQAPGLTVQVNPLPQRPTNFSGGVGKFTISASINKTEVEAGEPLSLRIVVGGLGNLKLIKEPQVNVPKDFDKYDAKLTDKTKISAQGVEGNMVYDVLLVPRNQGDYEIPAVTFTYFNVDTRKYETIKTESFRIHVNKGSGKSNALVDYSSEKDSDIKSIRFGELQRINANGIFFGSVSYWISLLLPLLTFIILLIVFRKRAINQADIVKMRGKKANKVATKRLKKANLLMIQNKQNAFYDEVLRALWGYIGDKLNMPVEKLSRENIEENLATLSVDDSTIQTFISAIDECEFARYAPGDSSGNMNKTINSAMTAITEIENVMKSYQHKKQSSNSMLKSLLFLMIISFISTSSYAITKQDADQAYKQSNYQLAIKYYEELLTKGANVDLYYNLGNAYYRTNNITKAIIAYERALLLSPGDADIRHNLQVANTKTIDKIVPEGKMFFSVCYDSLINFTSVDNWAYTAIVSMVAVLVLLLFFLFSSSIVIRKISFFVSLLFFSLFLCSNFFAYQQKKRLDNRNAAIVIAPSVTLKKTPSQTSENSIVIHEGTKVYIVDQTLKEWYQVNLSDGREGWLNPKQIEKI